MLEPPGRRSSRFLGLSPYIRINAERSRAGSGALMLLLIARTKFSDFSDQHHLYR